MPPAVDRPPVHAVTVPYVQEGYFPTEIAANIYPSEVDVTAAAQAWFQEESWQVGEREADADIAAGRLTFYGSGEDFLASI